MIPSTIKLGSRSTDVARWQTILGIAATGDFDAATEEATRAWQEARGLTADGVVGTMSWALALESAERVHGIDISYAQRKAVDFRAVKAAGFEFVYIKCTEGNAGKDSAFLDFAKSALDADLLVGAYHFARPSADDQDAIRELENMYGAAINLGLQLRPCLDLESTKLAPAATFEWCTTWTWLAYKYWLDHWPTLYTGAYFYETFGAKAAAATWMRNCPSFFAQYPIDPVKNPAGARAYVPGLSASPRVPKPFTRWDVWQYSGNGGKRVPGVAVDCDRDVFNGSLAEFRARMVVGAEPEMVG